MCAGGIWAIDGPVEKALGHGGLPGKAKPHGSSTQIEVAVSGGVHYLILNGVRVAEVPAPATSGTAYVLLAAFNRGTRSGSASFSDFSLSVRAGEHGHPEEAPAPAAISMPIRSW